MTTSSIVRGCQSCVTAGRTIECWDAGSASFGPPAQADWLSEAEAGKGAPGPLMARRPSLLGHMVSEAQFRLRGVHAPAEIKLSPISGIAPLIALRDLQLRRPQCLRAWCTQQKFLVKGYYKFTGRFIIYRPEAHNLSLRARKRQGTAHP